MKWNNEWKFKEILHIWVQFHELIDPNKSEVLLSITRITIAFSHGRNGDWTQAHLRLILNFGKMGSRSTSSSSVWFHFIKGYVAYTQLHRCRCDCKKLYLLVQLFRFVNICSSSKYRGAIMNSICQESLPLERYLTKNFSPIPDFLLLNLNLLIIFKDNNRSNHH